MSGPLAGIRIVDLTTVILGPYATQILGDLGADVIKVEPREGDNMRHSAPMKHAGMGHIFLHLNRNKRSIVLDLKQPAGHDAMLRLCANADVLIYNVRPQAMARLKLAYDDVRAANPKIIYVGAYGFSQNGPYAAKPAYDDLIQGMVALPSIIQQAGADRPRFVPSTVADRITGLNAVNAVTTALFHRERTGRGQYVEVPMLETMVAFVLAEHLGGLTFDPAPVKAGYARLLAGGRKPAPTKDGHIALLPYTDEHWRALFNTVGRADLAEKYGSADRQSRNANVVEMYRDMAAATREHTTAEWMTICASLDIPATPIYAIDDLPEHPHLKAVGLFGQAEHPSEGRIRYLNPPTKFGATPATVRLPAPLHGQHTQEILREAGYGEREIADLMARRIVSQSAVKD